MPLSVSSLARWNWKQQMFSRIRPVPSSRHCPNKLLGMRSLHRRSAKHLKICTKIQPCVLFCLKRSGTIQSHMKGTNGAAYVHSKQYMNSVCMYVCKYVCTYLCMYECMYECMNAWMYILTILGSHIKAHETWLSSIDCKHMQTPSIYPDIAQFKTFSTGISCSLGLPNMQLGWLSHLWVSRQLFSGAAFIINSCGEKPGAPWRVGTSEISKKRECCYEMLWTKMEKNLFNQFGHLKIHQDPVDIP